MSENQPPATDTTSVPRATPYVDESARAEATWWAAAQRAVGWLAADGQTFTVRDLVALGVPEPASSHWWGSLLSAASARGRIVACGQTTIARPGNSPYRVHQWRGALRQEGTND